MSRVVQGVMDGLVGLGDWAIFAWQTLRGIPGRGSSSHLVLALSYSIGVQSITVVAITGLFVGMVLSVQVYGMFHQIGIETTMGSLVNLSVVKELGPVLASVMLAGRVGSSMAAQLATMRISEQLDALKCLGVNPVHYLATPRFVASVLMIPLLTILADGTGVAGGAFICFNVYGIEPHHYWQHTRDFVHFSDVMSGIIKSIFFGGTLALISCHRGFQSRPGAEGVGRAATEAFVFSFVAILALDFFLALVLNRIMEMV
jgi:phospholipid/cholesterol/gamma-HCH transport system permease protein